MSVRIKPLALLCLLLASGCGQLLGLGDFHEAKDAGAGGTGNAGGTAGTAGASMGGSQSEGGMGGSLGGVGGSGGSSGAAAGDGGVSGSSGAGSGGTGPTELDCQPFGSAVTIFPPSDVGGADVEPLIVSDPGDGVVHIPLVVGNTFFIRSLRKSGSSAIDPRQVTVPNGTQVTDGYVEARDLHILGTHAGDLIEYTADLTSQSDLSAASVIASPCTQVGEARFYFDGSALHYAAQCKTTGEVFVDGTATPVFTSTTRRIRSMTFAGGKHFITLDDGGNGDFELRYSPSWTSQIVNHGLGGLSVGWLYPSSIPGSATMLQLEIDSGQTQGGVYWRVFDSTSPPSTLSPGDPTQISGIASFLYPVYGSPRSGRLSLGSTDLTGTQINLTVLGLDGTVYAVNKTVRTLASGNARQEVVAGALDLMSSVLLWVQDDSSDRSIEAQTAICQPPG